ncbi:MAG: hypothetical protein PVH00_08130, partial [Gemmatimonadota bacterium]
MTNHTTGRDEVADRLDPDDVELTGNHYLAFPDLRTGTLAIGSINVLQRALGGLLSWAGPQGLRGPPLLRIRFRSEGREADWERLGRERLDRWIPRVTGRLPGGPAIRVTICAPGGFDPLVRGAVVHVELDGGPADGTVEVEFAVAWGEPVQTVVTSRPLALSREAVPVDGGVVLEMGAAGRGAALALTVAGGSDRVSVEDGSGPAGSGVKRFSLWKTVGVGGQGRAAVTLCLGVAAERDGAVATARRLEELGGTDLVRRARLDLAQLSRSPDDAGARDLLARNLPFHHYFAAARAIDDDRMYPVMSRAPMNGGGAVFGEREALAWSLPAYCYTDPGVARELLMRSLEVWSDRPGLHRRYADGGIIDPGYSLGRACDWVLAVERYVALTRDATILDEPLVQQVLRELDDSLHRRLHRDIFLGRTEVLPGGERADYPYSAFDNALLWKVCRVLPELWRAVDGEPPPRLSGGDEEVEAAFWRHCVTDFNGLRVIAGTTDLEGHAAIYDDPAGTVSLLPWLGFCPADDPILSDTLELLRSADYPLWLGGRAHPGLAPRARPGAASFAALCAGLLSENRQ